MSVLRPPGQSDLPIDHKCQTIAALVRFVASIARLSPADVESCCRDPRAETPALCASESLLNIASACLDWADDLASPREAGIRADRPVFLDGCEIPLIASPSVQTVDVTQIVRSSSRESGDARAASVDGRKTGIVRHGKGQQSIVASHLHAVETVRQLWLSACVSAAVALLLRAVGVAPRTGQSFYGRRCHWLASHTPRMDHSPETSVVNRPAFITVYLPSGDVERI